MFPQLSFLFLRADVFCVLMPMPNARAMLLDAGGLLFWAASEDFRSRREGRELGVIGECRSSRTLRSYFRLRATPRTVHCFVDFNCKTILGGDAELLLVPPSQRRPELVGTNARSDDFPQTARGHLEQSNFLLVL